MAFRVVCKEEIAESATSLGDHFALTIQDAETDSPGFKVCFVVQGHTDSEKNMLVNSATNLKHVSVRMLLEVAAIFGYMILTQDVAQAYLQSAQSLIRKV